MAVAFEWEDGETQLTIKGSDQVTEEDYKKVFHYISDRISPTLESILVLRSEKNSVLDPTDGRVFGEKLGSLLNGRGLAVAVVVSLSQKDALMVSTTLFNKGIKLGQCENEKEARRWLNDQRTSIPASSNSTQSSNRSSL